MAGAPWPPPPTPAPPPTATSTLARHFSDAGDNPAWTITTDTTGTPTTTRYAESLGGDLAATIASDGTVELTLANLHGDVVTTIDIPTTQTSSGPATSIAGWADYTEYGTPHDPAGPAVVAGTVGYGWLGAKQRSTTTDTAGLTLMGKRLYDEAAGRFTSLDPVRGANANTYTYPGDPVNVADIDGRGPCGLSASWRDSAYNYAGCRRWRHSYVSRRRRLYRPRYDWADRFYGHRSLQAGLLIGGVMPYVRYPAFVLSALGIANMYLRPPRRRWRYYDNW